MKSTDRKILKKKKKPTKVQLNVKVFPSQKDWLTRFKEERGYPSLDRTLRQVIRDYKNQLSEHKKKIKELEQENSDYRDRFDKTGVAYDRTEAISLIIGDLLDYKEQVLKWPQELLKIEEEHLKGYVEYLKTQGELYPDEPNEDDEEEDE